MSGTRSPARSAQEDRPPAEAAGYERERPHLRIVDDETFFKAQGLLDENEAKVAARRQGKGRLRGSTKDRQRPRHLLQGLVRCGTCGSAFKVAGSHGKYLVCGGYRPEVCKSGRGSGGIGRSVSSWAPSATASCGTRPGTRPSLNLPRLPGSRGGSPVRTRRRRWRWRWPLSDRRSPDCWTRSSPGRPGRTCMTRQVRRSLANVA